jgi:hypothetical protein
MQLTQLVHHMEGGAGLDLVASIGALDDNASLRRVTRASSSMDQKSRAAAHVVGARGIQVVAVLHTLKFTHVAKGVGSLGKRTDRDLALAGGIVAAATRLTAAGTVSIDVAAIKGFAIKMMSALRVMVRSP